MLADTLGRAEGCFATLDGRPTGERAGGSHVTARLFR
jgi:hypothetical protein